MTNKKTPTYQRLTDEQINKVYRIGKTVGYTEWPDCITFIINNFPEQMTLVLDATQSNPCDEVSK